MCSSVYPGFECVHYFANDTLIKLFNSQSRVKMCTSMLVLLSFIQFEKVCFNNLLRTQVLLI